MFRLPVPSVGGEVLRFNNRDYLAFDDGGTLIWEHDHSKFVYLRDWCDHDISTNPGSPILNTQSGYFEIGDLIIQWAMRSNNTGRDTWTFPKPFTATALAGGGVCYEQRSGQTDGSTIETLYSIGTTSLQVRAWGRFELTGTGQPAIIAMGQQTGVVVPDEEQVPATFTPDEIDWNGRHMTDANDGGKDVWFINRRAYGWVDEQIAADEANRYFSVGNMLVNLESWPSGGGVRQKTFNKTFGTDVVPVIGGSALSTGSQKVKCFTVDENGCDFRTFPASSETSNSLDVTMLSVAALENPYPNPIRWPVPTEMGERFHYRRQFYIAESDGSKLVWAMDLDYRLDIDIDHVTSPETAEKLDINNIRLMAAQLLGGASDRTENYDHEFCAFPRIAPVASNAADEDRDVTVSTPIDGITFDGRALDLGGGLGQNPGALTSDPLNYIAIGLAADSFLCKLIAGWTLDGPGSSDKPEILASGWDFRAAGSADSELAVKLYGARQNSTTDPLQDRWFNLETAAWHNTGNAYFDGQSDFGISFWFYPYSSGTGTVGAVLCMSDDGSPIEIIYDDDTGTTINLQLHDVNTSVQSSPTVAVTVDQWNFLYFGWTASTKTVSVILNGDARQSAVKVIALPFEELDDGEPLTILRRTDQTDPVRGVLDELYLWSADLTDNEVSERLYNEGLGKQGPTF